jgi:hypothetical protein
MNPNKFFSLKRFSRFFVSDLLLNQKRYLYSLVAAFIGFYLIILLSMTYSPSSSRFYSENYLTPFILCLLVLGAFIGKAFPEFNDNVKTGNYLLLPASSFEKALAQFLIYFVLGSLLFVLFFWIDAHLVRWSMQLKESVQSGRVVIEPLQFSAIFKEMGAIRTLWDKLFCVTLIFSTGTFLFSVRLFFKHYALVKTVICGVGLFFFIICLLSFFSHLFYPEKTSGLGMELLSYKTSLNLENIQIFFYGITYFAWLFFLPLAYFKLKEKQL